MDNGISRGGEQGDPDEERAIEDAGREDMFVDCPDELIAVDGRNVDSKEAVAAEENWGENHVLQQQSRFNETENGIPDGYPTNRVEQLQSMLGKTVGEKESIAQEYQEERETLAKGVFSLHCQLKALNGQQPLLGGNDENLIDRLHKAEVGDKEEDIQVADISLKEMINECLQFLKTTSEEHLQTQATIRELHSILFMKDQEIEDLSSKVTEFSVSNDVVASYVNSVQRSVEVSPESQLEKVQHIEAVTDRTLASLMSLVDQEQLVDASVSGKVIHIEKGTSLLIEKYNQILFEINQLGQSLFEVGVDIREQDHMTIFGSARVQLLDLKRKEVDLIEKLGHLEDRNQKLVEQIDKESMMLETLNAELGKIKMELQQEKVKSVNTKEKLGMAVTKGKALVQQRDFLKHSLADKTTELEKCLTELQEKSSALEAAELTKDELLQTESMVASLQKTLSQSNMIIEEVEEILFHTSLPEELQSLDTVERFRWLVEDRNVLKGVFLEFNKLKDALALIDLPDTVSSSNLESQINWLAESCCRANDKLIVLQHETSATREAAHNEIDRLNASLSVELQEKDYLQTELIDLKWKYEEIVGKNHHISLERDQIVKMLLELSGLEMEDQGFDLSSSDIFMVINKCFQAIKEKTIPLSGSLNIDADFFERILSVLYIRDQELKLCEDILEEEKPIRLQVNELSNELKVAYEELLALKEMKGSLQKDLERSDDKSSVLREKLSMAVKKGKGLVQDRENLKALLNEKNSEIEQLKLDLQKQESAVAECKDQIIRLSTDVESIPKLEAKLVALKGERDQFEQFLLESNKMLQRMIEAIDGVVLPGDSVNEEPGEKVRWLAEFFSKSQHAEQEFGRLKEKAETLGSKLAEAQATVRSLEESLADAQNNISELIEAKKELELGKENVEQELQRVKEEVSSLTIKFAKNCMVTRSLEDALSLAEKDISVLCNEKEEALVSKAAAEVELEKVKEEAATQTSKLAEASKIIKSLENALSQAKTTKLADAIDGIVLPDDSVNEEPAEKVRWLSEFFSKSQDAKILADQEFAQLKDEADTLGSKLAEAQETVRSLEESLADAQINISELVEEKKELELGKENVEQELQRVKEEVSSLTIKFAEACLITKSLEDALSLAEKDISVLSNEKEEAIISRAAAEVELEKVKEEAATQTSKLAEASKTIKSLENALSQAKTSKLAEAIDGIILPDDSLNEKPAEKVRWLSEFFSKSQDAKVLAEQEFAQLKDEAETLGSKLAEAQATVRYLEESLADAQNNTSELVEAKKELELGKENVEQELQRVKEEVSSLTIKFAEACMTTKSLEDALSLAEKDISVLCNEKDEVVVSRAAAEVKLEKVKEEAATQTSELAEASRAIKSLENALSLTEGTVTSLTEQYNGAQVVKFNMENELKKLQEEAVSQTVKLVDAYATIKSLEDALLKAQDDISVLEGEKRSASEEILSLNSKLSACMDELSGKSDSLKSNSVELIGHLDDLQMLMKDDNLLFKIKECFEKKLESLRNMDFILRNIRDHIVYMIPKDPQTHVLMEDDLYGEKDFSGGLEKFDVEVYSVEINDSDTDDISSYLGKNLEGFHLRRKTIADKFDGFSYFIDEYISAILGKLMAAKNDIATMYKHMEALKEQVRCTEIYKQDLENIIAMLENNVKVIMSACTDATKELQFEVGNEKYYLSPSSILEHENLKYGADAHQQRLDGSKYNGAVEKLITATKEVQALIKVFERRHDVATGTIEDLQGKLKETQAASEKFAEERDLNQNRVSQLESEIQVLQNSCSELRLNLDGYHAKEEKLKEREADLSSLYSTMLSKEQETQNSFLSVVTGLQHRISSLSDDKEELQSTLGKQALEIEHLKKEIENSNRNWVDSEKHAMAMFLEYENSKSKVLELGNKLLGSQKVVDELTTHVELLEGSLQERNSHPEIVQERSIFEAPTLPTGSEISEVEDVGSLVKKTTSPVQSAAHVRNMRKGSSDHLALDIDLESDRLINNLDSDEDKGHLFKSLNTSGLIPKQGKLIADQFDGIWVSGGRVLMSRPRARLGVIAYCLLLHVWLLGTIL
ncbi:golgin subfamily B member 1-like isoform X1 [Quillaja saponaria]|uniref:Golgin subfamily B member 1-like isoform X1 n=1 Tax=Quillaja saponaria TaxID=32244 RepID=A0AAD7PJA4_QUISA|nr:golgin subfamily B member 1-like isoform X1 [Quillaja saponaria]